jgi:hypothetical protein
MKEVDWTVLVLSINGLELYMGFVSPSRFLAPNPAYSELVGGATTGRPLPIQKRTLMRSRNSPKAV